MKKMSKITKLIAVLLCVVTVISCSGINAFALNRPKGYYRFRHDSKNYSYGGSIAKTDISSYMQFYGGFYNNRMRSNGEDNFSFYKGPKKYKISNIKRTISFFANGIGVSDVTFSLGSDTNLSGGIKFSEKSKTITVKNDSSFEYYVDTSIAILFNYGETHSLTYTVKNSKNKALKTLYDDTTLWYV